MIGKSRILLNKRRETHAIRWFVSQLNCTFCNCKTHAMLRCIDLFQGWWRRALFLIIPLEGWSPSNVIWENCCLQTLTMLLKSHLRKQMRTHLWKSMTTVTSDTLSGRRVWNWTVTQWQRKLSKLVPEISSLPGLLKSRLTRSKLKNSNKSLSICLLANVVARPGPPWARQLLAAPHLCALRSRMRNRQDSFLQLTSRAQRYVKLTAGVKKLDLTASKNTLSGPLLLASLSLLYGILRKSVSVFACCSNRLSNFL